MTRAAKITINELCDLMADTTVLECHSSHIHDWGGPRKLKLLRHAPGTGTVTNCLMSDDEPLLFTVFDQNGILNIKVFDEFWFVNLGALLASKKRYNYQTFSAILSHYGIGSAGCDDEDVTVMFSGRSKRSPLVIQEGLAACITTRWNNNVCKVVMAYCVDSYELSDTIAEEFGDIEWEPA